MPQLRPQTDVVTPRTAPFSCAWRAGRRGVAWVQPRGELDMAAASRLDQALHAAEAAARMVVLDLRELDFMDCSSLHVVFDASARLDLENRGLVVIPGGSEVELLFELTGARETLAVFDLDSLDLPAALLGTDEGGRLREMHDCQ